MPYYIVCPDCGSHLDPGETYNCDKKLNMIAKCAYVIKSLITLKLYRR